MKTVLFDELLAGRFSDQDLHNDTQCFSLDDSKQFEQKQALIFDPKMVRFRALINVRMNAKKSALPSISVRRFSFSFTLMGHDLYISCDKLSMKKYYGKQKKNNLRSVK